MLGKATTGYFVRVPVLVPVLPVPRWLVARDHDIMYPKTEPHTQAPFARSTGRASPSRLNVKRRHKNQKESGNPRSKCRPRDPKPHLEGERLSCRFPFQLPPSGLQLATVRHCGNCPLTVLRVHAHALRMGPLRIQQGTSTEFTGWSIPFLVIHIFMVARSTGELLLLRIGKSSTLLFLFFLSTFDGCPFLFS